MTALALGDVREMQGTCVVSADEPEVRELSVDEIDAVSGAAVNWYAVGRFAGMAVRVGGVAGVVGLAGAGAAVAAYIIVDHLND